MGLGYVLRPTAEGGLHITSADPEAPLTITPNYYGSDHDRTVGTALFRRMREPFETEPIAGRITAETLPGPAVQEDPGDHRRRPGPRTLRLPRHRHLRHGPGRGRRRRRPAARARHRGTAGR